MQNESNDIINIFRAFEYQAGKTVLSSLADDEEISEDEFERRQSALISQSLGISLEELENSVYARIDVDEPIEASTELKISNNKQVLFAGIRYAADDVRALAVSRMRPSPGIISALLMVIAILVVSIGVAAVAAKSYLTSDK